MGYDHTNLWHLREGHRHLIIGKPDHLLMENRKMRFHKQTHRNGKMIEHTEFLFCLFLDASAMVKLVKTEPGSARMRRAYESNNWIRTTWVCVAEVYGILKREYLKIEPNKYKEKLLLFQSYLDGKIEIEKNQLEGHLNRFFSAEELIKDSFEHKKRKYRLDFSDAMQFVTLRERYKIFLRESKPLLVTSDSGMIKAAEKENIDVWNPVTSDLETLRRGCVTKVHKRKDPDRRKEDR